MSDRTLFWIRIHWSPGPNTRPFCPRCLAESGEIACGEGMTEENLEATLSRRVVLRSFAVGAVGVAFLRRGVLEAASDRSVSLSADVWLSIDTAGRVELVSHKVEMGQGIHEAFRRIVAHTLSLPPLSVHVVQARSAPRYGNLGTGGSFSLAGGPRRVQQAAATLLELLRRSAAKRWNVASGACRAADGRMVSGARSLPYRVLVEDASHLPVPKPESVPIPRLEPASLEAISSSKRLYHEAIVSGSLHYSLERSEPDMVCASIERSPRLNGSVVSVDARDAEKVPGYIGWIKLVGNQWPTLDHVRAGVAVLAKDHWSAQQARRQLRVAWRGGLRSDSESQLDAMVQATRESGLLARREGRPRFTPNAFVAEASYRFPYLSHSAIEPLGATARIENGRMKVWSGCQRQRRLHDAIVRELGFAEDRVRVYSPPIGGGFGRRLEIDYGLEAAMLAKLTGRCVQTLWTREDDFRAGLFRPGSVSRLQAELTPRGRIRTLHHRVVGESVLAQQLPQTLAADGSDWTMCIHLNAFYYDVPNLEFDHRPLAPALPCAWWRGTGATVVQVSTELFMDELAASQNADPLQFRLNHLHSARPKTLHIREGDDVEFQSGLMRRVLVKAAKLSGWSALAPSRRGVAAGFYDCPNTYTAAVVSLAEDSDTPRIDSITIVSDCGIVIDRSGAAAQIESNVHFAIGAALWQKIDVVDGVVQNTTFRDFRLATIEDTPRTNIHFLRSERPPSGLGEPATPVVTSAIANAWRARQQQPIRSFP